MGGRPWTISASTLRLDSGPPLSVAVIVSGIGSSLSLGKDPQQVAHLLAAGERVRKRQLRLDRVVVAAAAALAREVARGGQLDDDAVHGSLGEADGVAYVPQPDTGIARDARQHLGVVGQERPGRVRALGHEHKNRISRFADQLLSCAGWIRTARPCPTGSSNPPVSRPKERTR